MLIWDRVKLQAEHAHRWALERQQSTFLATGCAIALLLLLFSGVTAAVAAVAAWIALLRHFAQSDADRERRITESFIKAVEQLPSNHQEVRLGGIYILKRISRESPRDYRTVMEVLTAFVRARSWLRDTEGDDRFAPPPTEIAAVLVVIARRPEQQRTREEGKDWQINLSGAYIPKASLGMVHLESAWLARAHLEVANLIGAYLQNALLARAHLQGACLDGAHLQRAVLLEAHLHGASLIRADLREANLVGAHFEGADLYGARLEAADLSKAFGDAQTRLSDGVSRPSSWPPADPD